MSNLLETEFTVGAIRLRPFSIGTKEAARKMGLSFITGGAEGLSEPEIERQMIAFVWLQSAPLPAVLKSLRQGDWQDRVDEFQFELSLDATPQIIAEINRIAKSVEAVAVEVQPRPGATDDAPGN
jgi:hypothetical protein